jgi:hypothetical protein
LFTDAGGQLVLIPVWFFGYLSLPNTTEALPLIEVLDWLHSMMLMRMISMLMMVCHPLLHQHESLGGALPSWWPMASEPWWAAEVAAHLPQVPTPVPFVCCKIFKKVDRLAVLVAIMKHLSLDFKRLTRTVLHCKLSSSEAALWDSALGNEQTRCQRPVYIMEMQEQHGRLLSLSHAGSVNPPADDDGGQEITEVVEQSQEQEVAEVVEQPQEQQVAAGNGRTEIGDAVHDQVEAAEAETERPHLVHDQVAS